MMSQTLDPLAVSEGVWDDLLTNIEAGQVIPIVGPDLLRIEIDGRVTSLDRYLAEQLLSECRRLYGERVTPPADDELTLNRVVCHLHAAIPENRNKPYAKVDQILKRLACEIPAALRKLAEISHFDLFVTTTFDGFLEQALNVERFGGQASTERVVYFPQEAKDLELDRNGHLTHPAVVYYLLGKSVPSAKWVICDEDLLEFVSAMQSESRGPRNLLGQLKEKHLLILGANIPDWLGRMFLRTARQGRLGAVENRLQVIADDRTSRDSNLVFFLKHFSSGTKIFPAGGAWEFVDELHRRWRERNPRQETAGGKPIVPPGRSMPPGAIFISYCKENLAEARQLKADMDEAGIPGWFDQEQLIGGDMYEYKIQKSIEECCGFVPLLSRTTEARTRDAYFRREWKWALRKAEGMSHTETFIMPALVDDLKVSEFREVEPALLTRTLFTLPGGKATPAFLERVRDLHETWKARRAERSRHAP